MNLWMSKWMSKWTSEWVNELVSEWVNVSSVDAEVVHKCQRFFSQQKERVKDFKSIILKYLESLVLTQQKVPR